MKFALLVLLFSCLLQWSWFVTFYCIKYYINNDFMTSWLKMKFFAVYPAVLKLSIFIFVSSQMLSTFHESKHTKKNTSNSSNRPRSYCTIHSLKEAACYKSIIDLRKPFRDCGKWKERKTEEPLNSSALNGWNSHSKCFSVYLYKQFSKLSERNHTDLLSAVLSGTCRTLSLCPRSKTPADRHPSVKLSVYSSDLPVNKYV